MFYQPNISNGILSPEESAHATRVLRLRSGDAIAITDGAGHVYQARITNADPAQCAFTVLSTEEQPRPFRIHIAIAPTKNSDRMEWFVEKAVELGIDSVRFMLCDNSERKTLKLERLEKVAVSAMKQSQQAWLPLLTPLASFQEIIEAPVDQKFIAFVDSSNPMHLKNRAKPEVEALVLIGPEGDFSADELKRALEHGFQKVSLGTHRLRTETAGIAACHILNLVNT